MVSAALPVGTGAPPKQGQPASPVTRGVNGGLPVDYDGTTPVVFKLWIAGGHGKSHMLSSELIPLLTGPGGTITAIVANGETEELGPLAPPALSVAGP